VIKYLLLVGIFVSGCSISDDGEGISYGYIRVSGFIVREVKHTGEETRISVKYTLTNSCQEFIQFQTLKNEDNTTEIAILGSAKHSNDCVSISEEQSREFTFKPIHSGEYTFKFWSKPGEFKTLTLNITDV